MRTKKVLSCFIAVLIALSIPGYSKSFFSSLVVVQAEGASSNAPVTRTTTIKVSYTLYEWWLIRWSNNQTICQVWVEHDGVPQAGEIEYACGDTIYNQWLTSVPCTVGSTAACPGYYLYLAYTTPQERTVDVDLAPATVEVTISGCDLNSQNNECDSLPNLVLTGVEPLPDEQIINIQGEMDGQAFNCPGSVCTLPIPATGEKGITANFWANSSYGDSSDHYTAQIRAIPWGNFTAPDGQSSDQQKWYVNVISSQWSGAPLASASQIWSSFPPVGGLPDWLQTPSDPSQLSSNYSYYFLAGKIIQGGEADASSCPNNGLNSDGTADDCGLSAALPAVIDWQNQFNAEILQAANTVNVPAQLLKNVFGQESQFWPGIFHTDKEVGLGQMTDNGADTALLWNSDFFSQFCPLVYKSSICQKGYGNLTEDQQAVLRGAILQKIDATCADCAIGVDLSKANFSISVFARALLANAEQVGQIIFNLTGSQAGQVSSYVDLWKFTLANYNAGPGCLIAAMQSAYQQGQSLTWDSVSSQLEPACQGAIQYVSNITQANPQTQP